MSNINLKRFVDVDIHPRITPIILGTRDTVVLFTEDISNSDIGAQDILISSLEEGISIYEEFPTTLAYLNMYFENNGAKVLVKEGKAINSLIKDDLLALENKYICVLYAAPNNLISTTYSKFKDLTEAMYNDANVYGINEKLLITRTNVDDSTVTTENVKNLLVKYSTVLGAEMTIAAYLSRINVYSIDSIFDYAFTQEKIIPEELTDSTFGNILDHNMNVDINLANVVRNCGGNCKDGEDLVNNYVRIILHQTLTDNLIDLLTQKIKSTTGLSKIYTVIAQELQKYLTSGYLTTDKFWQEEDLVVTYPQVGGKQYTIIEKGTPLTNGYLIKILPFTALSEADKTNHSAPPIYIIIADQYGIRHLTINGEVI